MLPTRSSPRLRIPPGGWSTDSRLSLLSAHADLSILSVGSQLSALSAGCLLSIGSAGCILSVGSSGSILSVGSVGSILSVGSVGSILSVGKAFHVGGRRRHRRDGADVEPVGPARVVGLAVGTLALASAVLDR